jgi:hypothetical protein
LKVDGSHCWIWAFTTKAETLFAVRRSRGKKVLKEVLGRFQGRNSLRRVEILPKLYKPNSKVLGPPTERSQIPGRES